MITTVQHVIDCSNQHTHVAIASERRMLAAVGTLGTLVGLACVRRSVPRGTTMHLRGTLCYATAALERQFARSQRQAANLSRHPQCSKQLLWCAVLPSHRPTLPTSCVQHQE